jgi:hypothetical protein
LGNLERDGQDAFDRHGLGAHGAVHRRQGAFLPHWTREDGVYSVTFRLDDALPRHVWEGWIQERRDIIARARVQNRPISRAEEDR